MTDETALVPIPRDFQGIEVRIVTCDGTDMMPVTDIAKALDLDRSNLTKLLNRNKALFDGQTRVVKITTLHGSQALVCVTEFAAIGLLYKVSAIKSKTEEIQEKIVLFQRWATKLIQEKMQAKLIQPEPQGMWHSVSGAVGESVRRNLEAAKVVSVEFGIPLDLARAKALVISSRETGVDLTPYARLLPASTEVSERDGYLSASEIADRMGPAFNAYRINWFLKNKGYHWKDDVGEWHMTELGFKYGKKFPYAAGSGHVGYYLCWRPEIMRDSGMVR